MYWRTRGVCGSSPEVVQHFGDLKKPESTIGTGPFILERYEPNVKMAFTRNPDYFLTGLPWLDRVELLVIADQSTGLAMYRTGQIDCGPEWVWSVRQQDLEALKKSRPHFRYHDFLANVMGVLYIRTDEPPFNDVRIRRAISHAIDRQGIIDGLGTRGAPSPAVPAAWSSGPCPSINSARGPSTISTIRRRPGACWRTRALPRG